jgi:hypothetical protein
MVREISSVGPDWLVRFHGIAEFMWVELNHQWPAESIFNTRPFNGRIDR